MLAGMAYDLAALAKRNRPFSVITPRSTDEGALFRLYTPVIKRWRDSATRMMAAYTLAMQTGALAGLEEEDQETAADIAALLALIDFGAFFGRVETWHRGKWLASVSAATGVDATYLVQPAAPVGMNRAERRAAASRGLIPSARGIVTAGIDKAVSDAVAANVSLIRSVSDDTRARIFNAVMAGVRSGAKADDVARRINRGLTMSRDRARRIAESEMDKAVKAMNTARMVEAGIGLGEWVHNTPRERARLNHLARNGQVYDLSDPIWGDQMLPNCRCAMRARLEGLV